MLDRDWAATSDGWSTESAFALSIEQPLVHARGAPAACGSEGLLLEDCTATTLVLCDEVGLHEEVVVVVVEALGVLELVVLLQLLVPMFAVSWLAQWPLLLLGLDGLQVLPNLESTRWPGEDSRLSEVSGVKVVRGRWACRADYASFRSNGCCEHSAKQCAWCPRLSKLRLNVTNGLLSKTGQHTEH